VFSDKPLNVSYAGTRSAANHPERIYSSFGSGANADAPGFFFHQKDYVAWVFDGFAGLF